MYAGKNSGDDCFVNMVGQLVCDRHEVINYERLATLQRREEVGLSRQDAREI